MQGVAAQEIFIDSPENATFTDLTLPLDVSANETITEWIYELNQGGNFSFTPNISITGTIGSNNITVFTVITSFNSTRYGEGGYGEGGYGGSIIPESENRTSRFFTIRFPDIQRVLDAIRSSIYPTYFNQILPLVMLVSFLSIFIVSRRLL